MKKLLLATTLAVMASSAYAETEFYVRADLGAAFQPKQTEKGYKGKSANNLVGGLGVGTYLMDNVRAELNLSNHFNPKQTFKKSGNDDFKSKINATSLDVRFLVDAFDYDVAKLFVGAGIGATQLKAKFTSTDANVAGKSKKKTNANFLGTTGVSFNALEGVIFDLSYLYNNMGKTKSAGTKDTKVRFTTHSVLAGVRMEL